MSDQPLPEHKLCKRGKHHVHLSEFAAHPTNKDGRQDWCKACTNEYKRARYAARKNSVEVDP